MNSQSKLGRFLRREREGVRFCALFAVFAVLAFALLYASQNVLVAPLNRHLAWATEKFLRLFGAPTSSSGPVVVLANFAVEIKNNCNAVYEVGLYAAAVWAYPASLRDRLIGTLVGAGVLYAVNFLRILTLLALGVLYRPWFEATHLYAWQLFFLLVVASCWIAWVGRVRPVT
jgi:exosortase H (IPTLxxWG-CTERM-specific)